MNERATNQCAPGQIWLAGMHLDTEFPVPGDEELRTLWNEYTGKETARSLEEVYGVYTPKQNVRAIASIDLCEVTRETVQTFDRVVGIDPPRRRSRYAAEGSWFHPGAVGADVTRSVEVSVLRTLLANGLVPATEGAKEIHSLLSAWQEQGVYNIANTSTLPGCEPGTIRYSLGRDFPGVFDALILPRNHDGLGNISKAKALGIFAIEAGINIDSLPIAHIDDSAHHIEGFQHAFGEHDLLHLSVPVHEDNWALPAYMHTETSLEAFQKADEHFRKTGVIE